VIDAYFRSILSALRVSPVVQSHDITFDKRGPSAGYVRGVVFCADESQLHFREFVNTQPRVERFTYVYHYQAADGSMVFRFDDTPHFPDLPSFPHHKHLSDGTIVVACDAPALPQVLAEIETLTSRR
jgi:hypothetical protein